VVVSKALIDMVNDVVNDLIFMEREITPEAVTRELIDQKKLHFKSFNSGVFAQVDIVLKKYLVQKKRRPT